MRWMKSEFFEIIFRRHSGAEREPSVSDMNDAVASIRQAMTQLLKDYCAQHVSRPLYIRVQVATDLQDLWYLRGDVMAAIASYVGEPQARRLIETLSTQFYGLMPTPVTHRRTALSV